MMVPSFLRTTIFVFLALADVKAWSNNEKVKLTDIKTLTLYSGKWTTGRRSKPVLQLNCIGGSAGCKNFVPQVVQCYNRGSDGIDVQWECKTDMDNAYRFGQVDVICEGYDYPDDPYVLKGSCGLEYSLELTAEGMKKHGSQSWHGSDYFGSPNTKGSGRGGFSDLLFICIVLLFMYAIYRSCLRRQQYSSTADDFDHPDDTHRTGFGYPGAPPPPGFRPGFTPDPMSDSCGAGMGGRRAGAAPGVGGFWTGAAAGGLLGYMFGNRNNDRYRQPYYAPSPGGSSWGGGSSFSSGSSGTRTASGFGGTRRR